MALTSRLPLTDPQSASLLSNTTERRTHRIPRRRTLSYGLGCTHPPSKLFVTMPTPGPTAPAPSTTSTWPLKDIVYVAIVGGVMLAALLEWILWLLAFLYCLCKTFQKAQKEGQASIRVLAVLNMIFFLCMRCIFLPIMAVTLPLPSQVVVYFPERMVGMLQWFAFWSFSGLLTIPWLFCIYQLVTHNVGRERKVKTVLDEASAPKV